MARKMAIILYDPERIAATSPQCDEHLLLRQIKRGLLGYTYAAERGLIKISVFDQVEPIPAPEDERGG